MRIIFLGTPDYAVPVLSTLIDAGHDLVAVVAQPSRPAGRGRALSDPPTALWARAHGVPVLQPPSLRGPETAATLAALAPDVLVVASYGRLLPPPFLTIAPLGCLNVHPSLLPRHRGPSPVAEAILQGDAVTGVTIMFLDEGLDTGPLLASEARPVGPGDTTGALTLALFAQGGALLARTLPEWADGRIAAVPQDAAAATVSRKLEKADGALDFAQPAVQLARQVRAMDPWPGAYTTWQGGQLKTLRAVALPAGASAATTDGAPPGFVVALADAPTPLGVVTGDGVLGLLELQRAGRRPAPAPDFLRGHPNIIGAVLPN